MKVGTQAISHLCSKLFDSKVTKHDLNCKTTNKVSKTGPYKI